MLEPGGAELSKMGSLVEHVGPWGCRGWAWGEEGGRRGGYVKGKIPEDSMGVKSSIQMAAWEYRPASAEF